MTKKPWLNALLAALYIVLISTVMFYGTQFAPKGDTFLAPVAVISLFTLSASVMAYLFCYEPFQLYFAGKKSQALKFFLQTVLFFAIFTSISLISLFTGLIK